LSVSASLPVTSVSCALLDQGRRRFRDPMDRVCRWAMVFSVAPLGAQSQAGSRRGWERSRFSSPGVTSRYGRRQVGIVRQAGRDVVTSPSVRGPPASALSATSALPPASLAATGCARPSTPSPSWLQWTPVIADRRTSWRASAWPTHPGRCSDLDAHNSVADVPPLARDCPMRYAKRKTTGDERKTIDHLNRA
jgi:hypothetical protein